MEIALILLINYTSLGNRIVGAAPIGAAAWLPLIPLAAGMLTLEELRKWLVRRMANQSPLRSFSPSAHRESRFRHPPTELGG